MPNRHPPQQRRSQERVERILDAAARLLEDRGVEALSTRAVAERAGVSIGSLYRFFADVDDVLEAVARRYVAGLRESLAAARPDGSHGSWRDELQAVVDAIVAYCATEPGFRALWLGERLNPHLLEAQRTNGAVLADALRHLLEPLAPGRADPLAYRIAVEAGEPLLRLAFRDHPAGDPAVVAELQRLFVAYLRDDLDDDRAEPEREARSRRLRR